VPVGLSAICACMMWENDWLEYLFFNFFRASVPLRLRFQIGPIITPVQ